MPKELIRLLICQLLGWMALYSNESFFTDFIAQVIYIFYSPAFFNS